MKARSINVQKNIQKRVQPILLTPDEARDKQAELLVIDVQNPKYITSTIPEAQRLNVDISLKDIARSQPILVTCLSGQRSFTVAQQLIQRSYCKVYVLKGGLMAWIRAGHTAWLTKIPT